MKTRVPAILSFLSFSGLASGALAQDFDGDGYADLAVGSPYEDGAYANCGVVHVLYGGTGGLSGSGSQVFDQSVPGLGDSPEANDMFGYSLAWGDVNGDGCDDLAIGVPFEDVSIDHSKTVVADAGVVHVLFGGPGGLSASGALRYTEANYSPFELEAGDRFGYSVCIGQFIRNNDRKADLAVGAPRDGVNGAPAAGAVFVFPSPEDSGASAQIWTQGNSLAGTTSEAYDQFGSALAYGSLPNHDYLAIGVPDEDLGTSCPDAGAVVVIYCSSSWGALSAADAQLWWQSGYSVPDAAEAYDRFGASLATGFFSDPLQGSDLAIGVPGEDLGTSINAGAVCVLYHTDIGGPSRLTANGAEFWTQDSWGVPDVAEAGDGFGGALAVGRFNAGQQDLAVGVPGEDLGGVIDAGAVHVIYGGSGGLAGAGSQFWTQDTSGVLDAAEARDQFGFALVGADFDGDQHDDLAVSVPYEDFSSGTWSRGVADAGAVSVLYSRSGMPSFTGNQFWTQDSADIQDANETSDCFGFGRCGNP
ncbi:MAG: hypothetical protein EYC70_14275 [Planctomycetota bacterium]|nr:MAG: hypothetical protein EYC70_14275 [Planctomycetota bacterium]